MKYRRKDAVTSEVEAITFEELVQHGIDSGATLHDGVPWSFEYSGVHVTHETDDQYLFGAGLRFNRGTLLVTYREGDLMVWDMERFHDHYEPLPDPATLAKESLVQASKQFRKDLDEVLQRMKAFRDEIAAHGTSLAGIADDPRETVPNMVLSIRHVEDAIMRQGMFLKAVGNPNPYPTSYDPGSPKVEPTADGLKI